MSRNTVEQIISRFGSQQRVAELLGIWQTAVSGWVRRGAIPTRRQEQLLRLAQREGVSLAPADFFAEAGRRAGERFERACRRGGRDEPGQRRPDPASIKKVRR